jgi:hypothetical protein
MVSGRFPPPCRSCIARHRLTLMSRAALPIILKVLPSGTVSSHFCKRIFMQTEASEFERLVEALGLLPHEYLIRANCANGCGKTRITRCAVRIVEGLGSRRRVEVLPNQLSVQKWFVGNRRCEGEQHASPPALFSASHRHRFRLALRMNVEVPVILLADPFHCRLRRHRPRRQTPARHHPLPRHHESL